MKKAFYISFCLSACFCLLSPALAVEESADPESAGSEQMNLPASPTVNSEPKKRPPPINISARAEPEKVALGDSVTVVVQVHHPADVEVKFEGLPEAPQFDVKPLSSETLEAPEGRVTITKYSVQVFDVNEEGKAILPPARFRLFSKDLKGEAVNSPPVAVEVLTAMTKEKAATAEIDDVEALKNILRPHYGFLFTLLGLLLVALVFLAYRVASRLKPETKKTKLPPPPPMRPADEIALQKLNIIVAKEYLKRGDIESYYFEVSEVVREFFGNLYSFDSIEMTAEELMNKLVSIPTPGLEIDKLEAFLSHTDTIKFSEALPGSTQCSQVLDDAYYFVKTCKPNDFIKSGINNRNRVKSENGVKDGV